MVYAVEALQALARDPGSNAHLVEHAAWGPALWHLLLAEPEGTAYWVRHHLCCISLQPCKTCHVGHEPYNPCPASGAHGGHILDRSFHAQHWPDTIC